MDNSDYIAINFETANYNKKSACQVALVRFENGVKVDSRTCEKIVNFAAGNVHQSDSIQLFNAYCY